MSEPFDRSKAGYYNPHRLYEDPTLADIATDDHQVAALDRMRHQSDRLAGAPAPIPRNVKQSWLNRWVKAGLIELAPGDCYTIPGMAEAAKRRIDNAIAAGKARAGKAVRDEAGHFVPASDSPSAESSESLAGAGPAAPNTRSPPVTREAAVGSSECH
jgi:hypothetical protein